MTIDLEIPGSGLCGRSYQITPATISITGKVQLSVGKDLEVVLRKIEYWHQAPIIKFRIIARHDRTKAGRGESHTRFDERDLETEPQGHRADLGSTLFFAKSIISRSFK